MQGKYHGGMNITVFMFPLCRMKISIQSTIDQFICMDNNNRWTCKPIILPLFELCIRTKNERILTYLLASYHTAQL